MPAGICSDMWGGNICEQPLSLAIVFCAVHFDCILIAASVRRSSCVGAQRLCVDDASWATQSADRCGKYARGKHHSLFEYCDTDNGAVGVNRTAFTVLASTACVRSCNRCVQCALGYGVARTGLATLTTDQADATFTAMIPYVAGM